jgi:hypothetical protein
MSSRKQWDFKMGFASTSAQNISRGRKKSEGFWDGSENITSHPDTRGRPPWDHEFPIPFTRNPFQRDRI